MLGPAPFSPGASTEGGSSVAAASWSRPENLMQVEDAALEAFKVELQQKVVKHIKDVGVTAYIKKWLSTPQSRTELAKYLYETFPELDSVLYHHDRRIPPVSEADMGDSTPVPVHISMLGFCEDCSNKPYPGEEVFCQLSDQFLVDGFVTSSEPLLVSQSVHEEAVLQMSKEQFGTGTLQHFSLGYIKGFARATSIICWIHRMWKEGLDVKNHPKLYQSLFVVYVHHLQKDTKLDEALATMKFSSRGAIRKKTNVIQTVFMIEKLFTHGGLTDFTVFVRKWNAMSGNSDRILGRRSMAIKQLYECAPKAARELLLVGIGKTGWDNSPWSDDTLASKKLYPKFQFPSKSKKFANWIKTDDESMLLLIRHVHHDHDKRPSYMQKKMELHELESLCMRAAFVMNISRWVPSQMPIDQKKLQENFLNVWEKGEDAHLDVEVKVALIDMPDDFDPLVKITVLKRLVDEHMTTTVALPGPAVLGRKAALEVDEFQLMMKNFDFDLQLHSVWITKCSTAQGAREHARQEWKLNQRKALLEAATLYIDSCSHLLVWDATKPEEAIKSIMEFKRGIKNKLGLAMTVEKSIPNVVMLNWTCPALIPAPLLEAQQHKRTQNKQYGCPRIWNSCCKQTYIMLYNFLELADGCHSDGGRHKKDKQV